MIGMIMAGAAIVQGAQKYNKGRKEKKWGRRNARRAAESAAEIREKQEVIMGKMANERDLAINMRDEDRQRYIDMGYDQIEQDVGDMVREGVDVEGRASTAADQFTNQFDVSMDAQRRQMQAQGVRPGSAAMARLSEDAAFNRARGAATQANTARRQAEDQDFARKVAFADRGAQARTNILNQGANINAQYRGEYGMQGEIRSEFLGTKKEQEARARAGSAMMTAGVTQAVGGALTGGLGAANAGMLGQTAQGYAQQYINKGY